MVNLLYFYKIKTFWISIWINAEVNIKVDWTWSTFLRWLTVYDLYIPLSKNSVLYKMSTMSFIITWKMLCLLYTMIITSCIQVIYLCVWFISIEYITYIEISMNSICIFHMFVASIIILINRHFSWFFKFSILFVLANIFNHN